MAAKNHPGYVRVTLFLDPSEGLGLCSESLWAEPLENGRYRIRNSPFFAYGISVDDIVLARPDNGLLAVSRVIFRGNHSTYRLRLLGYSISSPEFERYWLPLQQLGCTFEEGPVLAVDVPAQTDIDAVYEFLQKGEADKIWEFEEGHCGHVSEAG